MQAPLVSVLIDTYNYGLYIEEAVRSVLAQDFPSDQLEILVVDDGSTDDTRERLEQFGDAIRYLRKPNGGQASAFNFGFEHAHGEIVALLDADDVWLRDKLKRVCQVFKLRPDAEMVYHRTYLWKGAEETSVDTYFTPIGGSVPKSRAALLRYPMIGTSCLAFRHKALEALLPVPETLRSQADAYLTALIIFVAPIAPISEFLAKYRLHGANAFQMNEERPLRSQIENRMAIRGALLAEIRAWLERHGYDLRLPDLQAYLKQWKNAQEADGFVLHAPGRWNYFRHLLEYPLTYGEIMSVRHRIYSYVRAFASLFLGYHHLHLVDDVRARCKQLVRKAAGKRALAEEGKNSGGEESGNDSGPTKRSEPAAQARCG